MAAGRMWVERINANYWGIENRHLKIPLICRHGRNFLFDWIASDGENESRIQANNRKKQKKKKQTQRMNERKPESKQKAREILLFTFQINIGCNPLRANEIKWEQ